MFKFWLFNQITIYLLLISLSVNLNLASCANLSPSIDIRYWKTNSSDSVVPEENLIDNSKYASKVGFPEVSTDKTIEATETVHVSRDIPTTTLALDDPIETSSDPPEFIAKSVTINPVPNTTGPYPSVKPRSTITWPLLFVLAILLFLLILVGWIVCQFLQREQEGQGETSGQMGRDTKVNTISSVAPSTGSGATATEELPTTRSELLVKSPLKKARAGDGESQKTLSRVNLSRTVSETVRSPMSSTKSIGDKESSLQSVATSPTSKRSSPSRTPSSSQVSSRVSSQSQSPSQVSVQPSAHSQASSPNQGAVTASEAYKSDLHK